MSGMAAFMAAVGGTSLICYLLMNRVQNRRTGARAQVATLPAQVRAAVPAAMAGTCFPGSAATVLRRDSSTSSSDSGGDSGGGGGGGGGGGD